jgi:hypothetical protein
VAPPPRELAGRPSTQPASKAGPIAAIVIVVVVAVVALAGAALFVLSK